MRTRPTRLLSLLLCLLLSLIALPGHAATGYTQTRYPVVLVHGLFGFDQLLGVDYWYGIPKALRDGGATVYVAQVTPLGNETARGEQLIAQLENLRASHPGYTKFNLIGHSQGGLTVRYAAATRPDLVASVTTIGTPHAGTPVADGVAGLLPAGSPQRALVAPFVNAFGSLISALSGDAGQTQSSINALTQLSTAGANQFNAAYPAGAPSSSCGSGAAQVNGIRYYSYAGTSVSTNLLDITDPVLIAGSLFFAGGVSDGLVGRCSAHWGTVVRDDLPWNHLDEVNQLLGIRGLFSPEPSAIYRSQLNRLQGLGL